MTITQLGAAMLGGLSVFVALGAGITLGISKDKELEGFLLLLFFALQIAFGVACYIAGKQG